MYAQCISASSPPGGSNPLNDVTDADCTIRTFTGVSPYEGIRFGVENGRTYTFKIDNVNWDNEEISLFRDSPLSYITGAESANGAYFTWIANFTGDVRLVATRNCATSSPYGWTSGLQSATLSYREAPGGDPTVFGSNEWNVYAYDGQDWNLGYGVAYGGFYTEPGISYDSRDRWPVTPSTASGYQGCTIPNDYHTVVSKRQGFPTGTYYIDINNHDDDAKLFINGTEVWSHAGCCDFHCNVWIGTLNSTSTVEFRHMEGVGGSNQGLNIKPYLTFGDNEWNVFAFSGRNRDNLASLSYQGFYTEPNLTYDSRNRWGSSNTPSDASNYK